MTRLRLTYIAMILIGTTLAQSVRADGPVIPADPQLIRKPIVQLRCAVGSAPKGTDDSKDLVLRVDLAKRAYLLGEPIYVRCRIINGTGKPVTIPYNAWPVVGTGTMDVKIKTPQETYVGWPRSISQALADGPRPIIFAPGQQFAVTIDLRHDYDMAQPATYEVTVEYRSDGKAYESDPNGSGKAIVHPAWSGHLCAEAGKIEVRRPSNDDDKAALDRLLTGWDLGKGHLHPLALVVLYTNDRNEDIRQRLIKELPDSRYTAYVRYYRAAALLKRWDWNPRREDAAAAAALLEKIDRDEYPALFQEMVVHRLIHARVLAGAEQEHTAALVKQFRKQFPHSPYALPDALTDSSSD